MEKAKVLIVEDDVDVLAVFRRIAERLNLEVLTAQDVYSALSHINEVDMLLLDLRLPNGNPSIIIEKWQAIDAGRPLAIISAFIGNGVEEDMFQRGAWNVLQKPVPVSTLERILLNYRNHVRWIKTASHIESRLTKLERTYSRVIRTNKILLLMLAVALGERLLPVLLKLF